MRSSFVVIMATVLLFAICSPAGAVTKTVCAAGCDYTTASGAMAWFVSNPTGADTILVTGSVNEASHIATWAPGVALIGTGDPVITEASLGNIRFATIADPTLPVIVKGITFSGFGVKSNTAGSKNYGGCFLITAGVGHKAVTFEDCTFDGCWAGGTGATGDTGRGSAIYRAAGSSALTLRGCTFTDCVSTYENAEECGGAVFVSGISGDLLVDTCVFGTTGHGNSVVGTPGDFYCMGGGLRVDDANVVVQATSFVDNSAENGAGMARWNMAANTTTITSCTFTSNAADHAGGGLMLEHVAATVAGCTFTGNSAGAFGGAYAGDAPLTMTECVFKTNTSAADAAALGLGGGFGASPTAKAHPVSLTGCIFQDNDAVDDGGAIYSVGAGNHSRTLTISECLFVDNDAAEGDAVYWEEPNVGYALTLSITNTIVAHNEGGNYSVATDGADNSLLAYTFTCLDTLDLVPGILEHDIAVCTNCINSSPAWCVWSDDDTANDDFLLRGSSPCYASSTCGHIGPATWCTGACGDSCWAPNMGGRRYGMRAER